MMCIDLQRLRSALVCILLVISWLMPAAYGQDAMPTLVVGALRNFPPQYSIDARTGQPQGFAIDTMNAAAKRLGGTVKYVLFDTRNELQQALQEQRIEVIPHMGITEDRKTRMAFTEPLEVFEIGLFVRASTHDIHSVADLKGRMTAVVQATLSAQIIQSQEGVIPMVHASASEALFALLSGHCDAFVYPAPALNALVRQARLSGRIKSVGKPLLEVKCAMAVRKDLPELFHRLNNVIQEYLKTPEFQQTYTKWYGEPEPFWTIKKVFWLMGTLFIGVALSLFLWRHYSLTRVNRLLLANEEQFRSLAENTQDYIMRYDREGRYLYENPAALRMSGLTLADIVGKTPREFGFDERLCELWEQRIKEVFETGQSRGETFTWESVEGTVTLDWRLFPEFDHAGQVESVLGVARDISNLVQTQDALSLSEERFRRALENIPDVIVIYDAGLRIRYINSAVRQLTGRPAADFIGKCEEESWPPEVYQAYLPTLKEAIQTKTTRRLETDLRLPNIGIRNLVITCVPLLNETGEVREVLGITQDFTGQKQQEQEYQELINGMNESVFVIDLHARFLDVNDTAVKMLGYSKEELLAFGPADIDPYLNPDDIMKLVEGMKSGEKQVFETQHRTRSGHIIPVEVSSSLVTYHGEKVILSIVRDITGRKRAEEALRQSRNLFRLLIEALPQNIFSKDLEGRFTFANQRYCLTQGKSVADIIGKTDFDLHPPEMAKKYREDDRWVIETGRLFETVEIHQPLGGEKFYVQVIKTPIYNANNQITGILGIFWDITEQKRAEEALAYERDLLHTLMDNLPDAIYFKDADSRFTRINKAQAKRFGLSDPAQAVDKTDFDFFTAEHAQQTYDDEQAIIRTGQPLVNIEEKEMWPDGRETWVSTTKLSFRDNQGHIIGTFGVSRDITERKRAEEEIKWLNEFNESIIQSMMEGIVIEDVEGYFIFLNPSAANIMGYPPEELVNRHWTTIIPPEQHPLVQAANERRIRGESDRYEVEVIRKDGARRHVMVSGIPRFDQDRFVGTLAVFSDITERKLAEQTLQQLNAELEDRVQERTAQLSATNQRLQAEITQREAIEVALQQAKEMAEAANQAKSAFLANMSHDLRTPLNAILGYAQIFQDAENLTERQRNGLRTIQSSGEHLLQLINDILDLSKIEAGRMELRIGDVHLPRLLAGVADMIQVRAQQQGIAVVTEFAADLPEGIRTDEKCLREVLLNLLGNAVKFAEQGRVTFRVYSHRLSDLPTSTPLSDETPEPTPTPSPEGNLAASPRENLLLKAPAPSQEGR